MPSSLVIAADWPLSLPPLGGAAAVAEGPALSPSRSAMVDPRAADDSFDAFVAARAATLVRIARGLLSDPHHAEDVVQDVLVKAHLHWARIRRTDNPDAYVRRMLVNACTSFWRRAVRREFATEHSSLPDRPTPGEASTALEQQDDRALLLRLLRRLPAKQRAVLVLRHYEGLSDAEIAGLLGTSPVTVRSNAHRGLATLRRLLAEEQR